ncbi:unnamed protein product [Sphenostylis stenocarpa]|uniref:Uncharacterized protein n=1 Tax=Sphenostylis stenocarpa TaxID=92480 RepID=A0AA86SQE5_9FABA|nr:unnamed protein product [Sphenostylis stenocarpa]
MRMRSGKRAALKDDVSSSQTPEPAVTPKNGVSDAPSLIGDSGDGENNYVDGFYTYLVIVGNCGKCGRKTVVVIAEEQEMKERVKATQNHEYAEGSCL